MIFPAGKPAVMEILSCYEVLDEADQVIAQVAIPRGTEQEYLPPHLLATL